MGGFDNTKSKLESDKVKAKLETPLPGGEGIGGIDETKVKLITESKAETQGPKVKGASESKGVESEITEIADAEGKKNPTLPDFVNF